MHVGCLHIAQFLSFLLEQTSSLNILYNLLDRLKGSGIENRGIGLLKLFSRCPTPLPPPERHQLPFK